MDVNNVKDAVTIANENHDTIQWVLRGGLGLLLMMIAYFLKQQVDVIKDLGIKMGKAMIHMQRNSDGILALAEKARDLKKRVDVHDRKLSEHGEDISSIKIKVGL